MQQEIIIKQKQYYETTEEENINKLRVSYHNVSFHTYDPSRPYLHIQIDGHDGFNFYLEMDEFKMKDLIQQLQDDLKKKRFYY